MEIIFNKQIEPHNKAEISSYLNKYSWLIPKWCQKITVNTIDGQNQGDVAGMRSRFEYREVEIDVYGYWFTKSPADKMDAIVHELCHLHNYQIFHFAENLIDEFVDCEKTKSFLKSEATKHLEGGTQDLTFAILNNERTNHHN